MTNTHMHNVAHVSGDMGYEGSVAGKCGVERRAAHGGSRYIQTCACGATREVLLNVGPAEVGPWVPTPTQTPMQRSAQWAADYAAAMRRRRAAGEL